MAKDLKFSAIVARLEQIKQQLETGELELEDVDKIVSEGLDLLKIARNKLSQLESKIEKVLKKGQSED